MIQQKSLKNNPLSPTAVPPIRKTTSALWMMLWPWSFRNNQLSQMHVMDTCLPQPYPNATHTRNIISGVVRIHRENKHTSCHEHHKLVEVPSIVINRPSPPSRPNIPPLPDKKIAEVLCFAFVAAFALSGVFPSLVLSTFLTTFAAFLTTFAPFVSWKIQCVNGYAGPSRDGCAFQGHISL